MTPRRLTKGDGAVAAVLAIAYVAVLVKTAHTLGYARDEGFYFAAAESYAGWFEKLFHAPMAALRRSAVDAAFGANHEHPVFAKSLFSLSWMFLYKRFHLFAEEGTSFRFPGMCFAGLTVATLYLWGTEAKSRRVGLLAALSFALVPTTFYHAHLDCFDVPIAAMWLLTAYCYWKSLARGTCFSAGSVSGAISSPGGCVSRSPSSRCSRSARSSSSRGGLGSGSTPRIASRTTSRFTPGTNITTWNFWGRPTSSRRSRAGMRG